MYVIANLKQGDKSKVGIVPVPLFISDVIFMPGHDIRYIRMEKVIMEYLDMIFEKYTVTEKDSKTSTFVSITSGLASITDSSLGDIQPVWSLNIFSAPISLINL